MAALNREDVYRSMLDDFVSQTGISTTLIQLGYQPLETLGLAGWYEWQFEGYTGEQTRTSDSLLGRGSVRVMVRTRAQVNATGRYDHGLPWQNTQTVIASTEGRDVQIKDHASGGGTSIVGMAQYQETQIDEVGEPADGVHTIICTTDFVLSAPQ